MLVLSRKKGESIIVAIPGHSEVKVIVVAVVGTDKVRIGIEADADIPVHRQEVWDAIRREREVRKNGNETGGLSDASGARN